MSSASRLENVITDIRQEAYEVFNAASAFNANVDNLLALHGDFDFNLLKFNGPFFVMTRAIEKDLEIFITDVEEIISRGEYCQSDIDRVYLFARPLFRAEHFNDDTLDRPHFKDPITQYLQYVSHVATVFETEEKLVVGTPYQDMFIKEILGKSLLDLPILKQKPYLELGSEVKAMAKYQLAILQYIYNSDPEDTITKYASLLRNIERKLRKLKCNLVDFASGNERKLFSINGDFVRGKTVKRSDWKEEARQRLEVKVAGTLSKSSDWGRNLRTVADYVFEVAREKDDFEHYDFFRYEKREFKPDDITQVSRRDLIGCRKQYTRVRKLLQAFASGREIPNLALIGDPGIGKTLTMKILAHEISDLKVVRIKSSDLHELSKIATNLGSKNYYTAIYIDDLQYDERFDRWVEEFKTATSGFKDFPRNVTVIIATNHDVFKRLPESARARFSEQIEYTYHRRNKRKVFESYCKKYGIKLSDGLIDVFNNKYHKKLAGPREIMEYVKSEAALVGIR